LRFCIQEGVYNSGKDCPEEILSFYFKQHLGQELQIDLATRYYVREQLYDLNWMQRDLSGDLWGGLHRNHTDSLMQLRASIEEVHLNMNVYSDSSVLPRWEQSMLRLHRVEHSFDTELCLHHFYHVSFYHNESESFFEVFSANGSFGFLESLATFAGRANCSGNIVHEDPTLSSNSYWKRYDEDHYPRLIPMSLSQSERRNPTGDNVYILIQDQWFCRNIGTLCNSSQGHNNLVTFVFD
jgi:hypothetical protein